MLRGRWLWLVVGVVVGNSLGFGVASAEEPGFEVEKASALFREGRRLTSEGRHGEACERFEQSLALANGLGTRFNLADCWERIGRTASAQEMFLQVAAAAQQTGQVDRERAARARAVELEPRLSRLAVEVQPSGDVTVRVTRNHIAIKSADFGRAVAVDPGPQEIEATAPGHLPWVSHVQVPASASTVWLTIPPLLVDPAVAAKRERLTRPTRKKPPAPQAPPKPERDLRALSLGLAAVGVAGVAAGTAFALKYRSFDKQADEICPSLVMPCAESDLDRRDALDKDAEAAGTGAIISFGVGGAALIGAGLSHWVFDTRRPKPRTGTTGPTLRVLPAVSAGTLGVVSGGSF